MSRFIDDEPEEPVAFIQWKGTDLCMDFHCDCGAHCHFDGDFAYVVECPHCGQKWEMPAYVVPRKVSAETYGPHVENSKMMEADEDYSDGFVEVAGVLRRKAIPVK